MQHIMIQSIKRLMCQSLRLRIWYSLLFRWAFVENITLFMCMSSYWTGSYIIIPAMIGTNGSVWHVWHPSCDPYVCLIIVQSPWQQYLGPKTCTQEITTQIVNWSQVAVGVCCFNPQRGAFDYLHIYTIKSKKVSYYLWMSLGRLVIYINVLY